MRSLVLCIALVLATGMTLVDAAERLESGTAVVVILEAEGNQPEPDPGPPTDILVFTGGRTYVIELPGCTDQVLPLQNAVLVDSNGPRSSRIVSAMTQITGPQGTGAPPGTRMGNFVVHGGCISEGITYRKYTATVE